jgi:uncharacterized phage protein (TIGR01671 family)
MNNLKLKTWWNNKMYYVAGIFFATQQEGEPEWENWGVPKQIALMDDPENSKLSWHDAEECILLQSTGQFDVNGKEIFVGDIIECHYINSNHIRTKKMIIEIDQICFDCLGKGNIADFNVIGNKYENPELIK